MEISTNDAPLLDAYYYNRVTHVAPYYNYWDTPFNYNYSTKQ